ncbi:MAG: RraA family protein [Bacillota bacterium]|nr:RraA family protein [Bacillota bacterium]
MSDEKVEKINNEIVKLRKQRDLEYQEYKKQGRIWGLVPRERITRIKFPRVKKEIIEEFLKLDDISTTVSDVLDTMGIKGAIASSHIKPIIPGKKIVGPAVTIRNIPERKTPTQGAIDKDFIKMSTRDIYYISEPGDVLVSDFAGNLDVSNMGGQSCTVAKTCGLAGNIIFGAARDVNTIKELDYPVWSCGTTQITGKFRMECIELNGPISLCGILVIPGDLMVADDSGVCVIPYENVEYVLEQCKAISKSEEKMRRLIVNKAPISELKPLFRNRYE